MPEPEAVKMTFGCGPGMCDMDVAHSKDEGERIYIGGAEGYLKVRVVLEMMDTLMAMFRAQEQNCR